MDVLGRSVSAGLLALTLCSAQAFEVLVDGRPRNYLPLSHAEQAWRICVLLPHGKDSYWWGVSWGIEQQARQLGVQVGIYQAGGYEFLEAQRRQWLECRRLRADAYVIAAIQATGLRAEIDQALAEKKPVIDLINGVEGPVSSRSLVSFAEMAAATVQHLMAQPRAQNGKPLRLAWFPGPAGAQWVEDGNTGLRSALRGKPVALIEGGQGPTDGKTQASLVRAAVQAHGEIDALLGNAVAIEFAARFFAGRDGPKPMLLAYYASDGILARIRDGSVLAAPTDQPIVQARIAIDLAVRALQGETLPQRVSPRIEVLDRERLLRFDLSRVQPPPKQWMVLQPLPPLPADAPASR